MPAFRITFPPFLAETERQFGIDRRKNDRAVGIYGQELRVEIGSRIEIGVQQPRIQRTQVLDVYLLVFGGNQFIADILTRTHPVPIGDKTFRPEQKSAHSTAADSEVLVSP